MMDQRRQAQGREALADDEKKSVGEVKEEERDEQDIGKELGHSSSCSRLANAEH